jgi:small subunit ribosomal protein S6
MKYELFYLVPSQYTDQELGGVMEKVAGLVEKAGGKLARHESLGRLKLAYPIKQSRNGVYVLAHMEAEPSTMKELDRQLRLAGDLVLRHQILKLPKGVETKKYQLVAYVAPLSEEARRERGEREGAPMRPRPPVMAPAPLPVRKEEALSIADLDKKLDEILESDVTKGV